MPIARRCSASKPWAFVSWPAICRRRADCRRASGWRRRRRREEDRLSGSLLLTGLLGGWLAADATALAQLLVSQPLVGGTLAGWIWGDAMTGMHVGALLQLFALAGLPLGGRTPEDFASAGVIGPIVALAVHHELPSATPAVPLVLGAVAGLVAAIVGRV